MAAYVLRRLLHAIPILLGVLLVTFFLFDIVCEDPALLNLPKGATKENVQEMRHRLGTDLPKAERLWNFVTQAAKLDFGNSWKVAKGRPVMEVIGEGVVPSLSLAVPAFLLEVLLAVSLALFCAYYRGSIADVATVIVTVAMMSVPVLSYVLFGQYFLAYEWKMFPVFGYEPGFRGVATLALPVLIWVALAIGGELRFYRTVFLEEIRKDYIRTAASKGLGTRRILFKHLLKNAMIPIITRVIVVIPFLILGSLLIERFFGIPGLGSLTVDAVTFGDLPVLKALVVLTALLLVVANIVTDLAYAWVDPRVRLQ